MTLIQNYRDFEQGTRFFVHGPDLSETIGKLLTGKTGVQFVVERIEFAGRFTDTEDGNDIANVLLVTTDDKGNPATPILQGAASAAGTTTVLNTGLAMTLNEHANRLLYMRTGDNAGEARLIASNTTGGAVTAAAFSNATAEDDEWSIIAANPADAAWDGTIFPVVPGLRLGNTGFTVGTADDTGSGGSPTHSTTTIITGGRVYPTGSLVGLGIEILTGAQAAETSTITANTSTPLYGTITFSPAIAGAVVDTDTFKITGESNTRHVEMEFGEKGLRLPSGKGLGFFQLVQDNFVGAFDYVKWTEMQIDVHGRMEAAGHNSGSHTSQFQPSGSV